MPILLCTSTANPVTPTLDRIGALRPGSGARLSAVAYIREGSRNLVEKSLDAKGSTRVGPKAALSVYSRVFQRILYVV